MTDAEKIILKEHDRLKGLATLAGSSKLDSRVQDAFNVYAYLADTAPYGTGNDRLTLDEAEASAKRVWGDEIPQEVLKALNSN